MLSAAIAVAQASASAMKISASLSFICSESASELIIER